MYSLANQKFFMLGLGFWKKEEAMKQQRLPKSSRCCFILIVVELTILRQRGQKKDFAQ